MKRFSSVQKLQAKTEHGKCILSHPVIERCPFEVHSQVMCQSRSTKHARLVLNQAWRTHLAININVTLKTCLNNRKLFHFKSKPD